jgi:prevent-host-death family protein
MITVTMHAAKTNLSRLVAAAEAGEQVIILRGRTPVARLVSVVAEPVRAFGALKDQVEVTPTFFEPLPADELEGWGS